jgi:hypothetical protein
MSGELKSQGSELYLLDETGSPTTVLKIGNLTSVGALGGSASDIDVTNLDSVAMEFLVGLLDNGAANLGINLDPQNQSHITLDSIKGGIRYSWALGLSDGTAAPTDNGSAFVLPTTRTFLTFSASLQQWQYDVQVNDAVRVTTALRVSGAITLTPKA